jgi:hypothetical protein
MRRFFLQLTLIFILSTNFVVFASDNDFTLCDQAGTLKNACSTHCGSDAIWTAIGCVPTSLSGLTTSLVKLLIGIGGGGAVIMIILGAFTVSTATSDPKRLQEGQSMVTQAILGLVLILFSVILLHFLGVDLLKLPGLNP